LKIKIAFILIFISLFLSILYGIDKFSSDNPNDSALIRIGLSNIDSSSCKICELNEIYYESGCKRCIQDGIVLTAHVSNERHYNVGWSNNNGMYYGDENCQGSQNFKNTSANINDTYYIEISKNDLLLHTNFYTDENFTNLKESISTEMCSNPTNLQYLRISNEDGKPPGNGGKLSGNIDEIEIFDTTNDKHKQIFSSSFNECSDKTCNDLWNFRNPEKIFVDTEKDVLSFSSEVLGMNDYAHLKLDHELPNSWEMRFKFQINELQEHPRGKGILNLEPDLRQIFLGLPAIILPFISYGITQKIKLNSFGIVIVITGITILTGTLFHMSEINSNLIILAVSVLIIILGILRMNIRSTKKY
tara:strand:- start:3654 stop:4733 length:1080 start_codon:yes stop_codon:yes gene_type:complete